MTDRISHFTLRTDGGSNIIPALRLFVHVAAVVPLDDKNENVLVILDTPLRDEDDGARLLHRAFISIIGVKGVTPHVHSPHRFPEIAPNLVAKIHGVLNHEQPKPTAFEDLDLFVSEWLAWDRIQKAVRPVLMESMRP